MRGYNLNHGVIACRLGSPTYAPLSGSTIIDTLYWLILKSLVWVLFPALFFRLPSAAPAPPLGLAAAHRLSGIAYGLVAAAIWLLLSLVESLATHQHVAVPTATWLVIVYTTLLTPLIEEVTFRGYVQGSLLDSGLPFWQSTGITTACFLIPHLIGWSFQGILGQQIASAHAAGIVLVSLYLGYVRYRSDSLLSSSIVHATNNAWSLFV
jgi:membrane protease YdiL (CAAX protease family)